MTNNMTNNTAFRDTRLFDALDYIDERFIAEITDKYEILNIPGEYKPNKRRVYKAYAVALARVACVVLLAGLVAMLPTVTPSLLEFISVSLPGEQPEDVWITEEGFLNEYFYPNNGHKYYGRFSDCYIMSFSSQTNSTAAVTVAGFKFTSALHDPIWVYYDGEKYLLQDAYNLKLLTYADIALLYERYTTLFWFSAAKNSDPVALTELQIRIIIYEKIKDKRYSSNFDRYYEYKLNCFAFEKDIYIISIPLESSGNIVTETVAGYKFSYDNSSPILVYKDGDFYSLTNAFEAGMINRSLVQDAFDSYNQHN